MIKHYFKVAFRSLWNDKVYLAINIVGLTIAIACCLLFIFWIRYELSFEKCYPHSERIYQVLEAEVRSDGVRKRMLIRPVIIDELKKDYPFVEEAIYMNSYSQSLTLETGEQIMFYSVHSTPDFFTIFPMQCIAGTTAGVGHSKQNVFISEEVARQYFGSPEEAIGKSLTRFADSDFAGIFVINGVIAIPSNTHIRFDMLILEISDIPAQYMEGTHYILLKKNYRLTNTNHYITEKLQQQMAESLGKLRSSKTTYLFQPIRDVHLHTDKYTEKVTYGGIYYNDIKEIRTFAFVVFLILLLAIINYVNTSTAKAVGRSKEVGVRKVLGSERNQLIVRFLIESFIISLIAVVLAMDVAKIFQPAFSGVTGNWFTIAFDGVTIGTAALVCVVTTLLSGGYAAFYLSSFLPGQALKGVSQTGSKEYLRRILVGIQFTLSIAILISTFVVYRQLNYIFNKDLGFDRDDIYMLDTSLWYDAETFIQELCKNPNVINATMASGTPFDVQWGYTGVEWTNSEEAIKETEFANIFCDYRFAPTFGLQMLEGEFIQPGYTWWQWTEEKSYSIVINEAFKSLLGIDPVIGAMITYYPLGTHYPVQGKIIGIVKDFHFKPLQNEISPLIVSFNPEACGQMYIKIRPENRKETLKYIESTYNRFKDTGVLQKDRPFMLTSLDTIYERLYHKEARMEKFLVLFSILSIVLSCMGIFGMTTFMIEKRTKEVALRKINGATVSDILSLFGKEFGLLVILSSLIAIPVTWLFMYRWLEQYVYRTTMGWWLFILVPLLIFIITVATIAAEVYKAALRNPVEALRSE